MTYVGVDMVRTVGRFRQYVSVLRDREFCDIKEIASATGRDVRKVLKDVKKNDYKRLVLSGTSG